MAKISGYLYDKFQKPIADADVYLKDKDFEDLARAKTDVSGYYELHLDSIAAPYLVMVKNYVEEYLEFWAHNIPDVEEISINGMIDTLEVYGINAFTVGGAFPSFMVYVRPMSLAKFKQESEDLYPFITEDSFQVTINNEKTRVMFSSEVKEGHPKGYLRGNLIQVVKPRELLEIGMNQIRVHLTDNEGNQGEALLFI